MASADCSSLAAAVAVGAGFHSSGHRTTLRLGVIALMCVVAGGYGARLHAQAVSALLHGRHDAAQLCSAAWPGPRCLGGCERDRHDWSAAFGLAGRAVATAVAAAGWAGLLLLPWMQHAASSSAHCCSGDQQHVYGCSTLIHAATECSAACGFATVAMLALLLRLWCWSCRARGAHAPEHGCCCRKGLQAGLLRPPPVVSGGCPQCASTPIVRVAAAPVPPDGHERSLEIARSLLGLSARTVVSHTRAVSRLAIGQSCEVVTTRPRSVAH